jgi:hypothetical protein
VSERALAAVRQSSVPEARPPGPPAPRARSGPPGLGLLHPRDRRGPGLRAADSPIKPRPRRSYRPRPPAEGKINFPVEDYDPSYFTSRGIAPPDEVTHRAEEIAAARDARVAEEAAHAGSAARGGAVPGGGPPSELSDDEPGQDGAPAVGSAVRRVRTRKRVAAQASIRFINAFNAGAGGEGGNEDEDEDDADRRSGTAGAASGAGGSSAGGGSGVPQPPARRKRARAEEHAPLPGGGGGGSGARGADTVSARPPPAEDPEELARMESMDAVIALTSLSAQPGVGGWNGSPLPPAAEPRRAPAPPAPWAPAAPPAAPSPAPPPAAAAAASAPAPVSAPAAAAGPEASEPPAPGPPGASGGAAPAAVPQDPLVPPAPGRGVGRTAAQPRDSQGRFMPSVGGGRGSGKGGGKGGRSGRGGGGGGGGGRRHQASGDYPAAAQLPAPSSHEDSPGYAHGGPFADGAEGGEPHAGQYAPVPDPAPPEPSPEALMAQLQQVLRQHQQQHQQRRQQHQLAAAAAAAAQAAPPAVELRQQLLQQAVLTGELPVEATPLILRLLAAGAAARPAQPHGAAPGQESVLATPPHAQFPRAAPHALGAAPQPSPAAPLAPLPAMLPHAAASLGTGLAAQLWGGTGSPAPAAQLGSALQQAALISSLGVAPAVPAATLAQAQLLGRSASLPSGDPLSALIQQMAGQAAPEQDPLQLVAAAAPPSGLAALFGVPDLGQPPAGRGGHAAHTGAALSALKLEEQGETEPHTEAPGTLPRAGSFAAWGLQALGPRLDSLGRPSDGSAPDAAGPGAAATVAATARSPAAGRLQPESAARELASALGAQLAPPRPGSRAAVAPERPRQRDQAERAPPGQLAKRAPAPLGAPSPRAQRAPSPGAAAGGPGAPAEVLILEPTRISLSEWQRPGEWLSRRVSELARGRATALRRGSGDGLSVSGGGGGGGGGGWPETIFVAPVFVGVAGLHSPPGAEPLDAGGGGSGGGGGGGGGAGHSAEGSERPGPGAHVQGSGSEGRYASGPGASGSSGRGMGSSSAGGGAGAAGAAGAQLGSAQHEGTSGSGSPEESGSADE